MAAYVQKVAFSRVKLDTTILDNIQRGLKKQFVVRVGVLGSKSTNRMNIEKKKFTSNNGKLKNVSWPSDLSNADIGLIHEKGSKSAGIPRRSFIEMPLQLKMPRAMAKVGQQVIDSLTKDNIRSVYRKWGILGENIIQGAFASRGYGRWKNNNAATIRRKGSDMPLIDTAQLRKSISSQVVTK